MVSFMGYFGSESNSYGGAYVGMRGETRKTLLRDEQQSPPCRRALLY